MNNKQQNSLNGKTRYCLFPFGKLYLAMDNRVGLCCSEQGRYVIMGSMSDEDFMSVWNNDKYKKIRLALLTGENLPPYCQSCERAPLIEPLMLQLDVALRQYIYCPDRSLKKFIKKNKKNYAGYLTSMKKIGESAVPYFFTYAVGKFNVGYINEKMQNINNLRLWRLVYVLRIAGRILQKKGF